ncbi:hypothetical protein ALC62_14833 [Cyphomyrmex costatus]|uniref:Uncharacterized protein n=1 Tax=Cyphomyrmex costatus TaxID=456900 RepID=A0A195C2F1_9HYME|nr:hypothetical protein ALC62_14833 [Cyphomyrmex costatus]
MRSRFTFWQLLQTQAPSCLPLRSRYRLPYTLDARELCYVRALWAVKDRMDI